MTKFLCLLFLFANSIYSQTKISETEKYNQIGLVWGILKYHHPEISQGLYNWDLELIKVLKDTDNLDEQETLNITLLTFIKRFNSPSTTFKTNPIKITQRLFSKKTMTMIG